VRRGKQTSCLNSTSPEKQKTKAQQADKKSVEYSPPKHIIQSGIAREVVTSSSKKLCVERPQDLTAIAKSGIPLIVIFGIEAILLRVQK
jgi:hypothetical protein